MVSGGADSRVLLFAADDPRRVTGINLYERHATETVVARQLCENAGTQFRSFQRDTDFYPRLLPEIVHWSGAMWSAEDSHYLGFSKEIASLAPDLLMTACTTDWLFKGYGLEKEAVRIFGKTLPFYRFKSLRAEGFLPNRPTPSPPALVDGVAERLEVWFEGTPHRLVSSRDRLVVEDRRTRPASYTVSVSGGIMSRTYPYDTFLADARIAACYSRIKAEWKLNGALWGKTAARVCAEGGQIVDANFGWPVGANMTEKVIRFAAGWVGRRLPFGRGRISDGAIGGVDRAPSAGSWPDCGWYAEHSDSLRDLWLSTSSDHRERMRFVAGEDPWDRPMAAWGRDGNRLMRISSLLAHWRECEARASRHRRVAGS